MDLNKIKNIYKNISYLSNWENINIANILKGFSKEYKFLIENLDSFEKVLLRVTEFKNYQDKLQEFKKMKLFNQCTDQFEMTRAIDIGIFDKPDDGYCWTLTTWIEGEDLRESLQSLSQEKQYQLGIDAGRLLKLFHSIEIPLEEKQSLFNRDNIDRKLKLIDEYENNSQIRFEGDEIFLKFIKNNMNDVLSTDNNKLSLKHSDYHINNMILTKDKSSFAIIDFNRCGYGIGLEEFQRVQHFTLEASIPFSVGQIDGYFNIPSDQIFKDRDFWKSFKTFVAMSSIGGVLWAYRNFDQFEVDNMTNLAKIALNNLNYNSINDENLFSPPNWYMNFKIKNNNK